MNSSFPKTLFRTTAHMGVAMALILGCTAKNPAPKDVLRVAIWSEPSTLEPGAPANWEAGWLSSLVYEPLLQKNKDQWVGRAAREWTFSPDKRTVQVKLKDAKWNDGVSVSARHFVDGWKSERRELASAKMRLVAKDDQTLEVSSAEPLLVEALQGLVPFRADIKKDHPANYAMPPHLRSNGPYRVHAWTRGESLLLELNPYYTRFGNGFRWIEFRLVRDLQEAVQKYQNSELDLLPLPSTLGESERKMLLTAGISDEAFQHSEVKFAVHPRVKVPTWTDAWPELQSAQLN